MSQKFADSNNFERVLQEDEDKRQSILPVRLNKTDQEIIKRSKPMLMQTKDSTTAKMLMRLGYECITQPVFVVYGDIIKGNIRKNKRLGIEFVD